MILPALVSASAFAPSTALHLIPSPQRVSLSGGSIDAGSGLRLELAEAGTAEDRFAVADFEEEFPRGRTRVLVGQWGRDPEIDNALARHKITPPIGKHPGAYVLSLSRLGMFAAGMDAAGTFYALQTLKQIVRANTTRETIPEVDIIDWPELKYRAWQDDISRGPIPTLDYLKLQVRTLSEYKLNAFTLYTEHVFKLEKHPTISPADGITAAEVRELSDYAKKYHVEVIGNFQSFGHFEHILKVPEYSHLGESGWVISPAKEESYKFLSDVYSEVAPAYSSSLFNINCDETGGLGTGASKRLVEQIGIGEVYARHINRIADLLRAYGKTSMMWGDIALAHREIVPKLPKDLVVLSWAYHAADRWDDMVTPFKDLGLKFWVCPGVSCWGQIFPDFENATVNISNFIRDGARNGAEGVINTTWDDSGENLFDNNWFLLAWGAETSWKPATPFAMNDRDAERQRRLAAFNASFVPIFFSHPGASKVDVFWRLSRLRENAASFALADRRSWGGAPGTLQDARELLRSAARIENDLVELQRVSKRNGDRLGAAVFAARRVRALAERRILLDKLDGWAEFGGSNEKLASECRRVAQLWKSLAGEYEAAWLAENRLWWLDRNLAKYRALASEIDGLPNTPVFTPSRREFAGKLDVGIRSLSGDADIRYTLDGTVPAANSPLFSAPITINQTSRIRARAFRGGTPVGGIADSTFYTTALACKFETNMPTYEDHRPLFAFDGTLDRFFWSAGSPKAGSVFTIVLDEPTSFSSIKATTGHPSHPADYVQSGVLEVSEDGRSFRQIAEFGREVAEGSPGAAKIRAIRIRITRDSNNWLVIREIEAKR
jgi:hypothetical protein